MGTVSGISAIVVYPMNALCNSQMEELEKYLSWGYAKGAEPVRFARYTGQESEDDRKALAANPPDILLTNYVMLELMLTRHSAPDPQVVEQARNLRFLVLDELHTYRGRQGADVAMLVRRVRDRTNSDLLCVGTSATMATEGTAEQRNQAVSRVASQLFGATVHPDNVVTETLRRVTDETTAHRRRKPLPQPSKPDYPSLRAIRYCKATPLQLGSKQHWACNDRTTTRREVGPHTAAPSLLPRRRVCFPNRAAIDKSGCWIYLREFLLLSFQTVDVAARPLFAFRLHQFIAGAGDVFTTLERPNERYLTVNGQQFRPGERTKPLFSAAFCRGCGQEYYPVWIAHADRCPTAIAPRELNEKSAGRGTHP